MIVSSRKDIPILVFLWKWKIASTRAVAAKYFPKNTVEAAYKRLLKLSKAGYIQSQRSGTDNKHVWQLSQKGFKLIKESLPPLEQDGYKSESISHDILASAVQIGDWIRGAPAGIRVYSEQELRRYTRVCLPKWFPNDSERRPDGYWDFNHNGAHELVALEVELTQKSEADYADIADYYNHTEEIHSVLWVTKDERLARFIYKAFADTQSPRASIHDFARANDFIKLGWRAPIFLGAHKGISISEFLNAKRQPAVNLQSNQRSTNEQLIDESPILNLQKGHRKTRTSKLFKIGEIFV